MTVHTTWDGAVVTVTIDRPERRNAVDHSTLLALRAAQVDAEQRGARAMVLTGSPPAFCAGADLTGVESGAFVHALSAVLHGFGELPLVTIAAIDGPALGAGTQLAIACDLRVATAASTFGVPAAKLGLVVDQWTVERAAREMGWPTARAMLLTARTYRCDQLLATGAIHQLGTLDDAHAWAAEIAALAPLTIATHKLMLGQAAPEPAVDDLIEDARARAWASADADEGRAAFLEKRPPRFTGS